MIKRTQNYVAESRLTLGVTALYGVVIWLLCGLVQQALWIQFACMVIATWLMVIINNSNLLIRIRSRMVSSSFIVLNCIACFTFPVMQQGIALLCIVLSLMLLFRTYQDRTAKGITFYTFLIIGLLSLIYVQALYLAVLYWLIMAFYLSAFSWRNLFASVLGLALPYWFLAAGVFIRYHLDMSRFTDHFTPLVQVTFPPHYETVSWPQWLLLGFLVILTVTGAIHFYRTSFYDKLQVRQIYHSLIFLGVLAMVIIFLQPQLYDLFILVAICTTSTLAAHFMALTNTKITNMAFFAIIMAAVALTAFNLWSSSLIS